MQKMVLALREAWSQSRMEPAALVQVAEISSIVNVQAWAASLYLQEFLQFPSSWAVQQTE